LNKDNIAERFVNEFPEFKPLFEEHIQYNDGELLPHVFFGECNDYFIKFLETEVTKELEKLFDFFERMAKGDEYVQELLSVTILERLGDNKEILNTAYKYMGKETRKASNEIEKFWGR
jgi:hypothetical protein